jgi:ankyrin repeat protein
VTQVDSRGQTALHHAASLDNVPVLCALMDAGAEIDAKDATHSTPLHIAATFKATGCITHLLRRYEAHRYGEYKARVHVELCESTYRRTYS